MKVSSLKITSLVLLLFCSFLNVNGQKKSGDINELVTLMTGSYTSEKQAKLDTTYYNISLHMYPIWVKDSSNSWLYIEQALNSKQDQPYRQRIYKVEHVSEDRYKTTIFKLKEEQKFIGKWKTPDYFDQYDTTVLEERIGCEVYLNKTEMTVFEGATLNDNCKSVLRGATYATSKVKILKNGIYSWDQGFDKEKKQVWGAEKEGYFFDKL